MKLLPLALVAAVGLAAAHPNDPEHRAARQLERQQTNLYRAYFPDLATGRKAAITFHANLLESAWKQGYLVLELDRSEITKLQGFGFKVEAAPDMVERRNRFLDQMDTARAGVESIPGYTCYETVEETFAAAEGIVASKPTLASWIDVGDSWAKTRGLGGYDLRVLKLTNSAITGDKPKLFINAAIHAREYTTAPLVLSFARWLADGYGTNADATWIVDHHEVHLMLHANPDGRKKAEAGLSWRKNTNTDYCSGNSVGADLNRNFTFQWNSTGGVGSSGNTCDLTYRGPAPASEPETQAIEAYIRSLWPDQRGPGLNDAAPITTSGIHIDIHSYSELVLWPWGTTSSPAPNGTALQTLGRRFAFFNNYTPTQSIGLYPTDGTSDGPSYGELGVAAYTFELGTSFFQSCSVYSSTVQPNNLPALVYAAKVVRTPYVTPAGPDVLSIALPTSVVAGTPATLTAQVTDTRFNQSNGTEPTHVIAGADAYIGTPPWVAGAVAIPLSAADGSFSSSTENISGNLPTTGLANGKHLVYVVGRDAAGVSGPVSAGFLTVGAAPPPAITLTVTKGAGTARRTPVTLTWSGATGTRVDMYRNDALVGSTPNDGTQTENRASGTWSYKICQTGSTSVCSATQSITTP